MNPKPTPTPDPQRRRRVQSAEVGMAVLKALGRLGGAASLSAVAHAVDESPAKVHRYLASLLQEGLVEQDSATQRYVLGPEAIQIGLAALRQCDPVRLGEPALVRLCEALSVTCFLAVMGNKGPTILRIEEPAQPVTVNVRAGSVLPTLWSATGQAFWAHGDDGALQALVAQDWLQASPEQRAPWPDAAALNPLRAQVRAQGCAVVQDTLLRGISAVAAPVFNHTGRVVAVLTALGASGGLDPNPSGEVAQRVRHEALALSEAMGWRRA